MVKKKNYRKPFYKDLLISRKNVLNSQKVFYFRKKKWSRFLFFSKKNLRFFRRRRFYDQSKTRIRRFASKGNSYKKQFRDFLVRSKLLRILYGRLKKKNFKKIFLESSAASGWFEADKKNVLFRLESRLDSALTKTKFCLTPGQAKQMIKHGHFLVNKIRVTKHDYFLRYGDIVQVAGSRKSRDLVKENLFRSIFWPLPPAYLKVNYKTLTFVNIRKKYSFSNMAAPFYLSLNFLKNSVRFK